MPDIAIGEMVEASAVNPQDLLVMEQDGVAKKLKGQTLETWLLRMADSHGGIRSVAKKSTSGLVDTYRITLSDETTFDFEVTNGRGIKSIAKKSTSGLTDTYTITYTDSSTSTFQIKNGAKGDKGDAVFVWIRYASQEPTNASHDMSVLPDDWMGVYTGPSATPPTNWTQYAWFKIKGEHGNTGNAATLQSSTVQYQASKSGTVVPSGTWKTSVPSVPQGRFLWTKTTLQFNSGSAVEVYGVSRMGIDGLGSVSSVCNVSPDENGNVALTAEQLGAFPVTGGIMQGPVDMAGQNLTGINEPEEEADAVPKGYADRINAQKADLPKTAAGEVISITDAIHAPLQGLKIYGRTIQNGIPTPEAPIALESVGGDGTIDVTSCGKNLFDISTVEIINSNAGFETNGNSIHVFSKVTTGTYHGVKSASLRLKGGVTYTISGNVDNYVSGVGRFNLRRSAGQYITGGGITGITATGYYSTSYTPAEDIDVYMAIAVTAGDTGIAGDITFSNIQLEVGASATAYEPYDGNTITATVPGGLPGNQVASGGNYTDADGQPWICDEVDFEKGQYIQRVETVVLDGDEEDLKVENYTDTASGVSYKRINCVASGASTQYRTSAISSHFKKYSEKNAEYGMGLISSSGKIFLYLSESMQSFTTAQAKAWLADNPVTVQYVLAEEKYTDLSAEELAQFNAIHTNNPNTTVFNDAGTGMIVKYATAETALPITGGGMGGSINMGGHGLTGIPAPINESDAVPLSYAGELLMQSLNYTDEKVDEIRQVPASKTADNGKFLTVVNGVPTWTTMSQWSGGSY